MKVLITASVLVAALTGAGVAFASAEKFAVDSASSQVRWEGKKKLVDSKHYGTVKVQAGELEVAKNEIKKGKFTIDLNSISNEDVSDPEYNQKLVGHLKSDDFFNVEKFPTSTFEILSTRPLKGNNDANYEIVGKLTIKGSTQTVKFPAKVEVKDGALSGKGQLTIDRTQFGLKYGSDKFFKNLGDKVIHDQIVFDINLIAKKS